MFRIYFTLILSSLLFSSCLTSSRIGIYQQSETLTNIGLRGNPTVLIFSVPINDKSTVNDLIKRITKIDKNIETRSVARQKGVQIPTHIPPELIQENLSKLASQGYYQNVIIVDGYPMPTEINGGNLVSTIIEVWDISTKEIIYNSHSTVKSKTRYINNDSGSMGGSIFNGIVGEPVPAEELLTQGLRREIRKLKRVY